MSAIALMGVDTAEKFELLTKKTYKKQAVWFLNAFWEDYFKTDESREKIWEYCNLMMKLDPKGENGNELDEFKALEDAVDAEATPKSKMPHRRRKAVGNTAVKNISARQLRKPSAAVCQEK